jgi:hypothetical protein
LSPESAFLSFLFLRIVIQAFTESIIRKTIYTLSVIEEYAFGSITIDGKKYTSDVIITGENVTSWWREEGHVLQPADLSSVIDHNPHTLVVGTGAYGRLHIPEETEKYLKKRGISLIAEKTEKAVDIFNGLSQKKAAALHLTC